MRQKSLQLRRRSALDGGDSVCSRTPATRHTICYKHEPCERLERATESKVVHAPEIIGLRRRVAVTCVSIDEVHFSPKVHSALSFLSNAPEPHYLSERVVSPSVCCFWSAAWMNLFISLLIVDFFEVHR